MLYLPKIGNIKIGGMDKGLPVKYNKIKVTTTCKEGEENFKLFNSEKLPETTQLKVVLPFLHNIEESFVVGNISFLIVNNKYKYYAKQVKKTVYLIPYEPDMEKSEPLPIIRLGHLSTWGNRLDLKPRAVLYAYILEENEGQIDFIDGLFGVFMFKTENPYTITETMNTLQLMKESVLVPDLVGHVNTKSLRFANFTLEYHRKLKDFASGEEINYVRLLPPSLSEIRKSKEIANENRDLYRYLNRIDQQYCEEKENIDKEAISLKEFEKWLGEKMIFRLDNMDFVDGLRASSNKVQAQQNTTQAGIDPEKINQQQEEVKLNTNIAKEIIKELNLSLPVPLITTFVKKFGSKESAVNKIKEILDTKETKILEITDIINAIKN